MTIADFGTHLTGWGDRRRAWRFPFDAAGYRSISSLVPPLFHEIATAGKASEVTQIYEGANQISA